MSIIPRITNNSKLFSLVKKLEIMDIEIKNNNPEEWSKLTTNGIDFIPDPMIIRTAELFFNGRSGCTNLGIDSEKVWNSIQQNIDGLLAFFDILLTRDKIPLVQYWLTFESPQKSLKEILDTYIIPVTVEYALYNDIKKNATENLKELDFNRLPSSMFRDIEEELGSYQHEWRPQVDLDIPDNWRRTAEFLLGGFIFSGYAQASQSDHVIQSKRSRLYTELMIPENEPILYGYHKEKELFEAFKHYCEARQYTSVNEFRFAPNILPLLLNKISFQKDNPKHLLELAINYREKAIGNSYKEWWNKVRGNWQLGKKNIQAEKEMTLIYQELNRKLKDEFSTKEHIVTAELEASATKGISFKLSKEISITAINKWIRGWYMKNLPVNQHRKFMYRMYLAEATYDRLDLGLKKLWWNN